MKLYIAPDSDIRTNWNHIIKQCFENKTYVKNTYSKALSNLDVKTIKNPQLFHEHDRKNVLRPFGFFDDFKEQIRFKWILNTEEGFFYFSNHEILTPQNVLFCFRNEVNL